MTNVNQTETNGIPLDDTREKLRDDAVDWLKDNFACSTPLMSELDVWLDRQAAITERECRRPNWEYCETCETIDELQAKVDELQAALDAKEQLERDSAYMRLPVDVNGVPIRPGDRLEHKRGKHQFECDTLVLYSDGWRVHSDDSGLYNPDQCRHVQPDTVESVLDELLEEARCVFHEDGSCEMGVTYERRAEYAERIRKAVEHG